MLDWATASCPIRTPSLVNTGPLPPQWPAVTPTRAAGSTKPSVQLSDSLPGGRWMISIPG
ncbi:Uncharacterised protein [Mycobacteroides abscessus subsp. abscessus]|nr:Uncharacterised protein [Mycobacteroides abscessus subsp. abscessus]SKU92738.1 Uncharacterised protein [Mycobacteroides abscessus subsp. abscessus]SKV49877.1 Uncharacterised protein [Mycobacteroides abscessus subsp. abscessus]